MAPRRAVLGLTAAAALVAGIAVCGVILAGDEDDRVATAVFGLTVGWSFVGTGLVAWSRRPDNRTGPLMVAVGFGWFLAGLQFADNDQLSTAGLLLENLFIVPLGYLLLAFPDGRLHSTLERAVVVVALVDATVVQLLWMLVSDDEGGANLLLVEPMDDLAFAILQTQRVVGILLSAVTVALLAQRWRRASEPLRRAIGPVVLAGAAAFAALFVSAFNDAIDQPLGDVELLAWLVFAAVPFAFLAGLLRTRLARTAVAELVLELGETTEPGGLRDALARALHDPSLALAYWLPDQSRYVDVEGRPVELPADEEEDRAATFVERDGRPIAALVHDPAIREDYELLDSVCAAAGLALENERLQAELRARLEELRASRERIVQAGQAERRRIERNLHDGTQQRLVSISMALGLAESKLSTDPEAARPVLREARQALSSALTELRELSQGIHPGILTERGLGPALVELTYRGGTPVELALGLEERLPEQVEAAAYYVVSESLANAAKHADATAVKVRVGRENGRAIVEIADDGVGGADGQRGSGLRGLRDRVEALGGRFALVSPPGRGTIIRAEIPCA
jgi:signal transduction histidine kinase